MDQKLCITGRDGKLTKNRYGKKSGLQLQIRQGRLRSQLERVSFTAPFKVTSPFYDEAGRMRIMVMSVSAGIMAGDSQLLDIDVGKGARTEIMSQSYEKIHRMQPGDLAVRETRIKVAADGLLVYSPLPVIPYAESSFRNETEIYLEDQTARLFYSEILACGRASRGERFAFRSYQSMLKIRSQEGLIYMDNSCFRPEENAMESYCMFEGFSHMSNLLLVNIRPDNTQNESLMELAAEFTGGIAGISRTGCGDICIRALANGSEPLISLHESVKKILI